MSEKPKNHIIKKYLIAVLIALLFAVFIFWPLPYYVEAPGSADNLQNYITVDGKSDQDEGSFMLTTVSMMPATPFTAFLAKVLPFQDLESKAVVRGGSSSKEYEQMQHYYMESSQNTAKQVALDLAGEQYTFEYKGVYVMSIEDLSSFKESLAVGDIIYGVEDQVFENSAELMAYIKSLQVGQEITVDYLRNGEKKTAKGKLIELTSDKKPGIGITLIDQTEIRSNKKIEIDAGSIGGPSAGLMFTLEIYSLLTGKDLRRGRSIAGTGTIASNGEVGAIGGIDKKVAAANKAGATIFFAPKAKGNYDEAVKAGKKINTNMKIVPVETVNDALLYLEQK